MNTISNSEDRFSSKLDYFNHLFECAAIANPNLIMKEVHLSNRTAFLLFINDKIKSLGYMDREFLLEADLKMVNNDKKCRDKAEDTVILELASNWIKYLEKKI